MAHGMVTSNREPRWFFYPGWVVLSAITIPIAWVIAWALISQIEKAVGGTVQVAGQTHVTEDLLGFYVFIPVLGLLSGLLQYALLHHYLPRPGGWITATLLGWLLAFLVFRLFTVILPPSLDITALWRALGVAFISGVAGLPQWRVLRSRVRHAAWWILANVVGWGMVGLLAGQNLSNPLAMLAPGAMPALVTGVTWWLLLNWFPQREREARAPGQEVMN